MFQLIYMIYNACIPTSITITYHPQRNPPPPPPVTSSTGYRHRSRNHVLLRRSIHER